MKLNKTKAQLQASGSMNWVEDPTVTPRGASSSNRSTTASGR
jgi:hypothetical protein